MEQYEKPLTPSEIKAEVVRVYESDNLEIMNKGSIVLDGIRREVANLYSENLRDRSLSWHALASSTPKTEEKPLPSHIEEKIASTITNLINRGLKPLFR